MKIPANYRRLEGSERRRAPGAKRRYVAKAKDSLSVTIRVRRRPGAQAIENQPAETTRVPKDQRPISRDEFAALYGSAQDELDRIAEFARSNGLTILEMSIPRRTVIVEGTVAQMNRAFGVSLGIYDTPQGSFRGREGFIHLPRDVADLVEGVFGLDNRPIGGRNVVAGAPVAQLLTPPQVASLYNFPAPPKEITNQTIGLIEMGGGYDPSDVTVFMTGLGLSAPPLKNVLVDGVQNSTGVDPGADQEVLMDICIAASVAPGATIAVYFSSTTLPGWPQPTATQKGWVDVINRAIHPDLTQGDPTPSVLSISNFISNGDDPQTLLNGVTQDVITAIDAIYEDAKNLNITILVASGDNGSDSNIGDSMHNAHVQYPASSAWVTACGGTRISNINGATFVETTWNDDSGATGGGISDFFDRPDYQVAAGVPVSANNNGRVGRGVPDIAGNASANSGYQISTDDENFVASGTSAVAPLYAGLVAILNALKGSPVGFLNPTLYKLGSESGVFRDITDGNNITNGAKGYTAGKGWDACTGWGSIDGRALLAAL